MMRTATVTLVVFALTGAFQPPAQADEFQPLCADLESGHHNCWNPVEVFGHEGCHFFGHVSYFDHAPPMMWSGHCGNGMAAGLGVLSDDRGNSAEGLLVDGLKEGAWTVHLADGGVIKENHVKGVFHGPWTFDLQNGRFYALVYEDGRMHGPWERRDDDGYRKVGTVRDDVFDGIFTITWPNGVEARVPYVDGEIEGKVTVTLNGQPLGALFYGDDKRYGVLDPIPIGEPSAP